MSNLSGNTKRRGPAPGDPRMVLYGQRGGLTVKQERGREFFQRIGRKGGLATKSRYGVEHYSEIGRRHSHQAEAPPEGG